MTQNPNRNMAKGQEQKRNERRPDENKAVRPENAQKNVQKTERRENPVKAEPRVEGKPRTEEKSAPAADTRVSAKPEVKPETKPEVKAEAKPEAKAEIKPEVKAEIKPEFKPETKPEAKAESKPESKLEVKSEVKPEAKPEQKSAFKTGDRGGKPTHTSVVREVNIISGVQLEEPDTTETKKYTPKTVEKKRDTHQKTVVREVNILSDIPAADPNASPFRTAPGWDKKAEKKAETVPETVDTAAARAESVAEAVELPTVEIAAAVAEDIADELPTVEIAAASMEASAAENAGDAEKAGDAGDAGDAETKFSRHTDDESLSMDELLGALPENVREPDRKKVGVTESEMNAAVDFVNTLLRDMQIDAVCAPVACPEGEEYEIVGEADRYPAVEITGSGSGILIGHHGETLDAIQCLLNLASIRKSDHEAGADYVKIALDIENYRAKREETLRALAKRMAARAVKYKRNVFLEPMNAYERRIIHSELQGVPFVSTHSVGTDKNRKIIITYEGPDKKPMGSGAPKKRRPNAPADSNPQAAGEENAERSRRNRKPGGAGEKKDRPRPPKPQKLPIESLPDFLANPTEEPIEHLRENLCRCREAPTGVVGKPRQA